MKEIKCCKKERRIKTDTNKSIEIVRFRKGRDVHNANIKKYKEHAKTCNISTNQTWLNSLSIRKKRFITQF